MEFQPGQGAETTHPRCPAQAGGGTLAMVAKPGLHGKGEADTELEMAKKGARVPIQTELHCCDPPV